VRFDVLTLFPEIFSGYLTQSLLKQAIDAGLVQVRLWNIRDWARGKHKQADDRPFGGGPGMVMMCEPIFAAVEAAQADAPEPGTLVMLTPTGRRLTQSVVKELSGLRRLLLLCGRYEGFDERVRLGLRPLELSVGDFITNGGEVPAMVVIDTVVRYVPGVLGDPDSLVEESHNDPGRLEYPQYTRPRSFRGMEVPEVLIGGNHQAVARWRREQSLARSRRPPEAPENAADITIGEGESHEEPIDGGDRGGQPEDGPA